MKIEDVTDWSTEWKQVEFKDNIKIVDISRGRSSAKFIAISNINNNRYIIFMKDILEMFPAMDGNCNINSIFVVRKRGVNFGLGLKAPFKADDNWRADNSKRVNPIPDYL